MTKDLRINSDRMLASFNQLALIGATAEGGVNRPTFSESHLEIGRAIKFDCQIVWHGLPFHRAFLQHAAGA